MKKNIHIIKAIEEGSIAEELGLRPGDVVIRVNGEEIEDVLDYHYLINDEYVELFVETEAGEEVIFEIEKDYEEDLGIEFEKGLMSDYRSCTNKCIFCFIDQNPPGMRDTIYFKDDDSRLSFLQGNYITMTNMKDKDLDRIIKFNMAPINISVHTTNPELRKQMLNNRFAHKIIDQIQRLYDGQIVMNAQIVLCKGWNDGEELERTISDLSRFMPYMESLSVVPMGMTKYRDGLTSIEPFNKEDALQVIAVIKKWQSKLYKEYGTHFVHGGDEWYVMAEFPVPEEKTYDGYVQLENGVGMIRLFINEFSEALKNSRGDEKIREVSLVTGELGAEYIYDAAAKIMSKFPNTKIYPYSIRNDFFGPRITVSGLLTGQDIIAQLKGKPLGSKLLLPCHLLRSGENILIDDVTIDDISRELNINIEIIESDGGDFLKKILD